MRAPDGVDLAGVASWNINLWSLSSISPDVNGTFINIPGNDFSFEILRTSGGIKNFNPALFTIFLTPNNGTGGYSGGGKWSIFSDGNSLFLQRDVPEPATAGLLGLVLAGVGFAGRRARRA